jgi:hypothetical protein
MIERLEIGLAAVEPLAKWLTLIIAILFVAFLLDNLRFPKRKR